MTGIDYNEEDYNIVMQGTADVQHGTTSFGESCGSQAGEQHTERWTDLGEVSPVMGSARTAWDSLKVNAEILGRAIVDFSDRIDMTKAAIEKNDELGDEELAQILFNFKSVQEAQQFLAHGPMYYTAE